MGTCDEAPPTTFFRHEPKGGQCKMRLFIARQPVFDGENMLAAYEIVHGIVRTEWNGEEPPELEHPGDRLLSETLTKHLDTLTAGTPALIEISSRTLFSGAIEKLPPDQIIFSVRGDQHFSEGLLEEITKLDSIGYRLSIQAPGSLQIDPRVLELVDLVEVDLLSTPPEILETRLPALRSERVRFLVRNVDRSDAHAMCRKLGFDYFSGYFYSRPEAIVQQELTVKQLAIIRLLSRLRDVNRSLAELDTAFKAEPSLSERLLRFANSAVFGTGRIETTGRAIQFLGRERLHRWLALLLVTSISDRGGPGSEVVLTLLTRARLSESLARVSRRRSADDLLFLTGLFSLFDTIVARPFDELIDELALGGLIERALLEREGPLAPLLRLVEAYEVGDWDTAIGIARAEGVEVGIIPELYLEAVSWARERLEDPDL